MSNFSRATRLAAVLAMLSLLAACTTLRGDFTKPVSAALPAPADTQSARYIDSETSKHALHASGFRLLTLNTNALMSRVVLASKAERSLDLQYYIFNDDATGKLVAQQLLKAADRGVRVRLLLDDITQASRYPCSTRSMPTRTSRSDCSTPSTPASRPPCPRPRRCCSISAA
jgi:putative cardiolipin synthase